VTTYNEGVVPDPEIAAAVGAYEAELSGIMNAVKASTLGPISYTANAAGQSPMGNLIADAQRWKGGTQIAFMNPGGVRKPIQYSSYPHDITFGDFFTVQPFDNKLMTLTLTGEQIWAVLEQQFMPHQSGKNRVLMVSGIHFTYNLANVPGSRITSLTLDGGGPIAKDATTYTVTASNYLTGGGDSFSAFLGGTNLYYTGVSDLDALIEYVQYLYGAPGDADYTPIDPTLYPIIDDRVVKQ
jgi:5'-nucleotidase